jgi:hypothetical protein
LSITYLTLGTSLVARFINLKKIKIIYESVCIYIMSDLEAAHKIEENKPVHPPLQYIPRVIDELYVRILANHNSKAYFSGKVCYFPVSKEYVMLLLNDPHVSIDLRKKDQYVLYGYFPERINNTWRFIYDIIPAVRSRQ